LFLALAALAGCMSSTVTTSSTDPQGNGSLVAVPPSPLPPSNNSTFVPHVAKFAWNGTITGAGYQNAGFCCFSVTPMAQGDQESFSVGKGASSVFLTLSWPDKLDSMTLFVTGPDFQEFPLPQINGTSVRGSSGHFWANANGSVGAGASPLLLGPLPVGTLVGNWTAGVVVKDAVAEPFQLTANVYYNATTAAPKTS
jgi:hypothetical protein